jgi:hypothetical protein
VGGAAGRKLRRWLFIEGDCARERTSSLADESSRRAREWVAAIKRWPPPQGSGA